MFHNKIAGCLFGYAVGDALGIGTEFMTREEAALRYPGGLRDYNQIIKDAHRSQWHRGDYTADTRLVELLVQSITDKGCLDPHDYAKRLYDWIASDEATDAGSHLTVILRNPEYLEKPFEIARNAYLEHNFADFNDSLGRALFCGLWPGEFEKNIVDNCSLTHPDSKVIASALIIGAMANEILWHKREADFDLLYGLAKRVDESVIPYLETARNGKLSDFDLDNDENFGSARKSMGCALWSLWHHTDPETALYEVVDAAGDGDTNAALSLGLLGLKYGFNNLPSQLIENLRSKNRLQELSDKLTGILSSAVVSRDTDE